jgi:CelD/BcsL family acetyltransferase involved in cellulose biosynthesis
VTTWTTEVRTDHTVFDELAAWWNACPGPTATPFLRSEWFELWTDAFLPDGARLEVVVFRRDGRPAAALPLGRRGPKRFSLSNAHCDVYDAIIDADPDVARDAAARIADWLAHRPLTRIFKFDAASPILATDAATRWVTDGTAEAPYLALPASVDDVLATMSRNRRSAVKRNERKLTELGEVTFHDNAHDDTGGTLPDALDRCFELEAAGWKGTAGTAMNSRPDTERFYRALVARASDLGWLRLSTLLLDGRLVAFQLCLQHGDARHLLKLGFDENLSECSPGNVLQLKVLQAATGDGLARYEFGGESEDWKLRWTSTTAPRHNVIALGTRGPAAVLGTAGRIALDARRRLRERRSPTPSADAIHDTATV